MLPFTIQIQDNVPVSDQILLAVRKSMLTGQLRAGDAFPSVRALSQELRVSPTTAHKVVLQLKAEGYLASQPGIGMVVTAPLLPKLEERLAQLEPYCARLLEEAAALGLSLDEVITALRESQHPSKALLCAATSGQEPDMSKQPTPPAKL